MFVQEGDDEEKVQDDPPPPRKDKVTNAAQRAVARSMSFLEFILPNVSSAICETFICVEIDGKHYLRSQLWLECDGSSERRWWITYACVMLFLYLVLVPMYILYTLAVRRHEIKTLMTAVYREKDWRKQSIPKLARRLNVPVSKTVISLASKFEYFDPERCAAFCACRSWRVTQHTPPCAGGGLAPSSS